MAPTGETPGPSGEEHVEFDPSAAEERLRRLWSLSAEFGKERNAHHIYLNEIVSNRSRSRKMSRSNP